MRSVVIPSTVKTIEDYAFDGCHALSRVDIPAGVAKLGRKSFSPIGEVSFFANPPTGFSTSGLGNSAKILIPRKYVSSWKSYVTANNYAIRRGPTAAILSSKIREADPTMMEWIYIPKSEQYGKMKVSYNTLSEAQVFDVLMWLYAAKDPGLALSGGTLRGGGYPLASGAGLYGTTSSYDENGSYVGSHTIPCDYAARYIFSKMRWTLLTGSVLSYANNETRKGLKSYGTRQYACQIVEQ